MLTVKVWGIMKSVLKKKKRCCSDVTCMLPFIVFWAVTLGYTVRSIDPRGVADGVLKDRSVCILGIFLGGGNSPSPQKTLPIPLNSCQIVCCKSFLARGNELQIHRRNVLLTDNKRR